MTDINVARPDALEGRPIGGRTILKGAFGRRCASFAAAAGLIVAVFLFGAGPVYAGQSTQQERGWNCFDTRTNHWVTTHQPPSTIRDAHDPNQTLIRCEPRKETHVKRDCARGAGFGAAVEGARNPGARLRGAKTGGVWGCVTNALQGLIFD